MPELRLVTHASELLTGEGIRRKDGRKVLEADLGRIEDGAIAYNLKRIGEPRQIPHRIAWVGKTSDLPRKYLKLKRRSLKNERALVPGFIDCHTHLVFAGDRAEEFALRCAGASYEEIARRGGGIATSVASTREASEDVERLAIPRVKESYSFGVRALEIKSGYGLDVESELKLLRVVRRLRRKFPEMSFSSTFLGAHAFPKDKSREDYLREILDEMLPRVARAKLADSCDVFVDEGYFTVMEAREILKKAQALRMKLKVHADELGDTGSAAFAAQIGALSADHLLKVSEQGIQALARSSAVAVLLPGTAFYLKAAPAPARRLIEAGACVAIATDFNPGTCMSLSLPAMLTLGALYLGMSRAELFASVTYNAAKALGMEGRKGTLEAGKDASFVALPFRRFEEIYYRFAPAGFPPGGW